MVSSRAAHINGCPCCRAAITPGLTPFDAVPGRNNLLNNASDRDQIASRARAARQAVMARFMLRHGGGGGGGQSQGQVQGAGAGAGASHMRPRCVRACVRACVIGWLDG
jgi:hypothetical protein